MDEPRIVLAGLSDLGKVRDNQEDAWIVREPATGPERRRDGRLMVIADGVGSAAAGEIASRLTVDAIAESYFAGSGDARGRLRAAVQAANQRVLDDTEAHPERRGMGCTVVAAAIRGDRLTVTWLGDSRAYLLRDRSVIQVTRDDSLPVFSGRRGGINRWVGMGVVVDPSVREVTLHPGDRVLLCTDGLYTLVSDEEMARSASAQPSQWVSDLVQLSLKRGAPDNVTVIAARIDRLPFAPQRHPSLAPDAVVDGLQLMDQVGAGRYHSWYRAQSPSGLRLLYLLKPELQDDAELLLDMEEDEESLSRIQHPWIASVERADAEKSLAYVCLRLPWSDLEDSGEMHSLQDVLAMPGGPNGIGDVRLALQIGAGVAGALSAVRSTLLRSGAPHPTDFWGNGSRYALCRWPSPHRAYVIRTGKGIHANPMLRDYTPPDFGPDDFPGPASDAYFVGFLLRGLLGAPERGRLPRSVEELLDSLLADSARLRPDALAAIETALKQV